jgi:large subunit ribosomal protein L22
MEYVHTQKNLGHTPRKMKLVADMVRKMKPQKALEVLRFTLRFTPKAAAVDLAKAIKTALANTGPHSDHMVFKHLEVNEGADIKRYRVGTAGRGRGRPYEKRRSQIKITLVEEEGAHGTEG